MISDDDLSLLSERFGQMFIREIIKLRSFDHLVTNELFKAASGGFFSGYKHRTCEHISEFKTEEIIRHLKCKGEDNETRTKSRIRKTVGNLKNKSGLEKGRAKKL